MFTAPESSSAMLNTAPAMLLLHAQNVASCEIRMGVPGTRLYKRQHVLLKNVFSVNGVNMMTIVDNSLTSLKGTSFTISSL